MSTAAETGRPVLTQGEGNRTTAHLNLTTDMTRQVAEEAERKERFVTYGRVQRTRLRPTIQGQPTGWART